MVGIAVLLAGSVGAIVWYLSSIQPKTSPAVGFVPDDDLDRWIVTSAPRELPWSHYQIRASGFTGTVKVRLNYDAGAEGIVVGTTAVPLDATNFPGVIIGGHFLDFCASELEDQLEVTLVHIESNSILFQYKFRSVPADPACT